MHRLEVGVSSDASLTSDSVYACIEKSVFRCVDAGVSRDASLTSERHARERQTRERDAH